MFVEARKKSFALDAISVSYFWWRAAAINQLHPRPRPWLTSIVRMFLIRCIRNLVLNPYAHVHSDYERVGIHTPPSADKITTANTTHNNLQHILSFKQPQQTMLHHVTPNAFIIQKNYVLVAQSTSAGLMFTLCTCVCLFRNIAKMSPQCAVCTKTVKKT